MNYASSICDHLTALDSLFILTIETSFKIKNGCKFQVQLTYYRRTTFCRQFRNNNQQKGTHSKEISSLSSGKLAKHSSLHLALCNILPGTDMLPRYLFVLCKNIPSFISMKFFKPKLLALCNMSMRCHA